MSSLSRGRNILPGEVFVDHVRKTFRNVVAVDDVSLKILEGEFFVLLGPSGCGKTTTLRIIAGLEKADSGRVYIDGRDVTDLPPKDRDVAMVFQDYALYPHMKVYDNVAFPLKIRRMPKQEIGKRVKEVAELLGIDDVLDRYPHELSGGQQQRVALARALVRQPKIFLMDEPLSNLDAKIRIYLRSELKALQRKLNVTTIYVTHDQAEALSLGNRIAVMNKGKVMQVGTPDEIFNSPSNTFVANFIGSPPTNILEASITWSSDGVTLDFGEFKAKADNIIGKSYVNTAIEQYSDKILVGIRPEYFKFSLEPTLNSFAKGKVVVIEPLGSETILTVSIGSKLIKIKTFIDVKELGIKEGHEIWLEVDPRKVFVFNSKGDRIYY